MFNDITFAYPYILYLLLGIPILIYLYFKKYKKSTPDITFPSLSVLKGMKPTLREKLQHLPTILRFIVIGLVIIALARPQSFSSGENVYAEGIDIAMLFDISGSMLAEDFKPNRLEAAKSVIDGFVAGRETDKIGLVLFARESFTQCPLTIDYRVLRELLKDVKSATDYQGGVILDGTAIGTAIANGINRIKESKAKSKTLILLTDGVNNAGEVDPVTAAQIAQTFGIRIYTIGVGTRGQAPYPFRTPFGIQRQMIPVEIDEATLQKVANITSGKYFRATGNQVLKNVFAEIDKLEKTRVEITSYRQASEKFYSLVFIALFLLLAEQILSKTYLKRLP